MAIVNKQYYNNIGYTITPAIQNNVKSYSMATIYISITVCNYHGVHLNNIIFDLWCLHDNCQLLNINTEVCQTAQIVPSLIDAFD